MTNLGKVRWRLAQDKTKRQTSKVVGFTNGVIMGKGDNRYIFIYTNVSPKYRKQYIKVVD